MNEEWIPALVGKQERPAVVSYKNKEVLYCYSKQHALNKANKMNK